MLNIQCARSCSFSSSLQPSSLSLLIASPTRSSISALSDLSSCGTCCREPVTPAGRFSLPRGSGNCFTRTAWGRLEHRIRILALSKVTESKGRAHADAWACKGLQIRGKLPPASWLVDTSRTPMIIHVRFIGFPLRINSCLDELGYNWFLPAHAPRRRLSFAHRSSMSANWRR